MPGRLGPLLGVVLLLVSLPGCTAADVSVTTTTRPPATTTSTGGANSTTGADLAATPTTAATSTTDAGTRFDILVEGGAVVGGAGELRVDLGSEVVLVVLSDLADHVHVHGYDLFFSVGPDEETEIGFVADIPGIFEVELEGSGLLLLEIEVS